MGVSGLSLWTWPVKSDNKETLSGIDRGALPIKQIYLNLLNERQIVEIPGERLLDYDRQFS